MSLEAIREKMLRYYDNPTFVDKWLNTPNVHIIFQDYKPSEVFVMDNPDAIAVTNGFMKWLDKLCAN